MVDFKQTWLLGVILNIVGSWTINFGTNLVQYSYYYVTFQGRTRKLKILFCSGWIIFGIGNLINFISLRFTAQTVLSALGSVQLIANILNIYILFKIPPTKPQIYGTLLIVFGITSILLLSHLSTYTNLDYDESSDLLQQMDYIIYCIVLAVASIICELIYCYLRKSNTDYFDSQTSLLSPNAYFMYTDKVLLIMAIFYCFTSTMIGSQSIIFAKAMSLLATNVDVTNNITYLVVGLWFFTMIFWLYRMNHALKLFKSLFIIPLLQILWILFSIVNAIIFFKEMSGYEWYNFVGFICGLLVVFIGVYFLAPPTDREDVDDLLTASTWNIMFPRT